MIKWRQVRRAEIGSEVRDQCELFGEQVIALALAHQANLTNPALQVLTRDSYWQVVAWLRERRDVSERHEQRVEALEWAILIFVGIEVVVDLWPVLKLVMQAIGRAYAPPG